MKVTKGRIAAFGAELGCSVGVLLEQPTSTSDETAAIAPNAAMRPLVTFIGVCLS